MPTWRSFAAFSAAVAALGSDFNDAEVRKITRQMGKQAQDIANHAASRDLGGDRAFGGWNRGAPIPLDTRLRDGRNGATILSPTRHSAGPWTVAEFGRNQGNASGFHGPGINRATGITSRTKSGGVRRVRTFRGRRWNGVTRGRDTATDATREMDKKLPPIADRAVRDVIRKRFDVR